MTGKITLELTLEELKLIDKYVELNDETQSVFDKIKYAYPQPKMTFQQEGDYVVVSYNDTTYYRLMGEITFTWYHKKGVSANYHTPTLVMVTDGETERLLEGLYYNDVVVKKEKVSEWEPTPQTPEQVADGLKEAFREAVKQGVVSSHNKPKTLSDLIHDWWSDVFTHSDWDKKTCIENLVDEISLWLPTEHETNSYKWNECIRTIREKLR